MPITAPVSLTKIKTEFGGPDNLSAYVRGGSYVGNTPANAAISTTVAGLAMSQFLGASAFTPFTSVYTSGSATITAPVGASSVTIKVWGGGGGGGSGQTRSQGDAGGGGGGGGAYVLRTVSVTGGTTQFTYSVGTGGAGYIGEAPAGENEYADPGIDSTVVSTSPSISLSAGGGEGGQSSFWDGGTPPDRGFGGGGGLASGGTTNINGTAGQNAYTSGVFEFGGDGGAGANGGAGGLGGQLLIGDGGAGTTPGGGGGGGGTSGSSDNGGNGARGEIWFEWA